MNPNLKAITTCLLRTCISDTQILKGLVPPAAALVCALHTLLRAGGASIDYGRGVDLFAPTFVEHVVSELQKIIDGGSLTWSSRAVDDTAFGDDPSAESVSLTSRRGPNLVLLVSALYNLGLVGCQLIYGLIAALVRQIGHGKMDVEVLLILLREIGDRLRSDDPSALKGIVKLANEAKDNTNGESTDQSNRVRFMEE